MASRGDDVFDEDGSSTERLGILEVNWAASNPRIRNHLFWPISYTPILTPFMHLNGTSAIYNLDLEIDEE